MLPELFCDKMRRLLGQEAEEFFVDRPRQVGLRFNPRKTHDLPQFVTKPVLWAAHGYYYDPETRPGLHPYHDAGLYYMQEPSAMAPAMLLDARPEERVLDLCAAPGGKSTQLAAAMAGQGLLVCNEIHSKRAKILSGNIERLGFSNVLVLNETPQRLSQRFPGYFHKILVDAPCSGEGMFRKEEAAVTDWSLDTVAMCAKRQDEILEEAAKMLCPGGRLVYSTCTFSPEEDEGTIARFLNAHPEFSLVPANMPWFSSGHPEWADGNPALVHCLRLWPHKIGGEGHFAAILQKETGEASPQPSLQIGQKLPKEEILQTLPDGTVVQFGDSFYLAPKQTPCLDGLRVLRPGLELGRQCKGRFTPAHALALWLSDSPNVQSFSAESPEIFKYLRGETLPTTQKGWVLVQVDGYSIGWGKGADGILKNHYPKGLRRTT